MQSYCRRRIRASHRCPSHECAPVLQCVAVCCSVLQCITVFVRHINVHPISVHLFQKVTNSSWSHKLSHTHVHLSQIVTNSSGSRAPISNSLELVMESQTLAHTHWSSWMCHCVCCFTHSLDFLDVSLCTFCVCVSTHTHTHTHTHAHIWVGEGLIVYVCVCGWVGARVSKSHEHTHTHTHTEVRRCLTVYVCVCVHPTCVHL